MNLFSVRQPDLHDALPVHDAPHDAPPPRLPGPGSSAPWPAAPRSRRAAPSPSPGSHPRRPPPGSAAPWSAAPRSRHAAPSPSPGSHLSRCGRLCCCCSLRGSTASVGVLSAGNTPPAITGCRFPISRSHPSTAPPTLSHGRCCSPGRALGSRPGGKERKTLQPAGPGVR